MHLSNAILIFGYILPAISSAKAVLQKDEDGCTQWASYFLVIYFFKHIEPILDLILSPWIKLLAIILSLPRYHLSNIAQMKILGKKFLNYPLMKRIMALLMIIEDGIFIENDFRHMQQIISSTCDDIRTEHMPQLKRFDTISYDTMQDYAGDDDDISCNSIPSVILIRSCCS